MDYTHNEDKNKTPDSSNFDFLFRLYGLVPGSEPYDPPTPAPSFAPLPTFSPAVELDGGTSEQVNDGNRLLVVPNETDNGEVEEVDEIEMAASLAEARARIMAGNKKGVRLLYRGSHGEIHETDLVKGHKLRVHKLLPAAS